MSSNWNKGFKKLMKNRWAAYTFALCSAVVLYLALSHIGILFVAISALIGFISPVIYGIVIAYLINPLINIFEYKVFKKIKNENAKHTVSVAVGLILVFSLLGLLIGTLIPSLIDSFSSITGNFDNYWTTLNQFTEENADVFRKYNIDLAKMTRSWQQLLTDGVKIITDNIASIVVASQAVGQSATNFLLGLILAIYFLLAKKSLLKGFRRFRGLVLDDVTLEAHDRFFYRCHKILGQFIGFDILDGIIVGVINAVLMLIFRMPSVALISVIVGVTNLIPTFGPIIGAALGAVILVLTNPVQALIFLIFTVVIQIFDGYILKPKMFGESFGVPAVWILIYIIVGGKMFGIVGILLAIPFAAIVSFVYEENIIPWLTYRKEARENKVNKE
ncbi:MAG: AI-2E family transporter [Pseudobutyrivibrio sp.]|nr:AI-2E family transporter [Pseudobutyrivibrio sp.]